MRIYIFKSEAGTGLRAFAGEPAGSKLPDQFRPWHAVGVIPAEKAPPHNLSRGTIEKVINSDGISFGALRLSQ